ncbi:hypothetical protein IAD21_01402 [Abditibacteriota bacterium]|nr:hypothetical protein IAD21_01402 [Abditibacteriota bacterium]
MGALLLCTGCRPVSKTPPPPMAIPTPAPIHTDIAGLKRAIALPRPPIAVVWQQTQVGDGSMGPSDSQLLAVLQYAPAEADKIDQLARKRGKAQKGEVELRSWFPAPLRQKAVRLGDGRLVLRGDKLTPDDFAHLSLQNGFVLRVPNTPYIVVSLFTT